MFSFFKTKKKEVSIPAYLRNDLHAHLLPNIDDGPKTMQEAIDLVQMFAALGYQQITATPHVFNAYYPNTRQEILDSFNQLQVAVEKQKIDIQLHCAAEYYLDNHFSELVEKNCLLPVANKHLLVETSTMDEEPNIYEHIFQLQAKGWIPILAHPERYTYMKEKDYIRLKERGCLFQVNFLSLTGHYGRNVLKNARLLKSKGFIDFIATDAHHINHLKAIQEALQSKKTQRFLQSLSLKNERLFL